MRQITAIGKGGAADWSLGYKLTLPEGYTLCLGDPKLGVHPDSEFVPGMVADVCTVEGTVCCLLEGDDGEWFKQQVEEAGGRWVYHAGGILPTVSLVERGFINTFPTQVAAEHRRFSRLTGGLMNQKESMATGRRAVLANVRGSSWRSHSSRIVLTLSILVCGSVLSAPVRAGCKYAPTPNLLGGFSAPHTFQTQTLAQEAFPIAQEGDDASIVGFWHVLFTSGGQPFDQGYDQWHAGGTEILNDTAPPQPANGAGTICLGVYKKKKNRGYGLIRSSTHSGVSTQPEPW